jgi:hypothetical protein
VTLGVSEAGGGSVAVSVGAVTGVGVTAVASDEHGTDLAAGLGLVVEVDPPVPDGPQVGAPTDGDADGAGVAVGCWLLTAPG